MCLALIFFRKTDKLLSFDFDLLSILILVMFDFIIGLLLSFSFIQF